MSVIEFPSARRRSQINQQSDDALEAEISRAEGIAARALAAAEREGDGSDTGRDLVRSALLRQLADEMRDDGVDPLEILREQLSARG